MLLAPWISFILISFKLCAAPIILKFFLREYAKCSNLLLNADIYTPSRFNFIANLILFDI